MTTETLCTLVETLAKASSDRGLAIAALELAGRARGLGFMVDDLIRADLEEPARAPLELPATAAPARRRGPPTCSRCREEGHKRSSPSCPGLRLDASKDGE